MEVVRGVALGTRFLLELCSLAAFSYWGYRTGGGTAARIALAVAAPLVMIVVWGALDVSHPARPTHGRTRRDQGLVLFLAAATATSLALKRVSWQRSYGET